MFAIIVCTAFIVAENLPLSVWPGGVGDVSGELSLFIFVTYGCDTETSERFAAALEGFSIPWLAVIPLLSSVL